MDVRHNYKYKVVQMEWQPITLTQLEALLREGLEEADDDVIDMWSGMRIDPSRWKCSPYGDYAGGFWVVAVHDGVAVYYNDIEQGFNSSAYTTWGVIDEYRCEQFDFTEFLCRTSSKETPSSLTMDELPQEFGGPGVIVRRQTTYWTVRNEEGLLLRIHFVEKLEIRFAQAGFDNLAIVHQHPVLLDFNETRVELYFNGRVTDPAALHEAMTSRVNVMTHGWRRLVDYINTGIKFTDGFGLLFTGPVSLAKAIAEILREHGATCTILESTANDKRPVQALLMGMSFVVANAFRFERLRTGGG